MKFLPNPTKGSSSYITIKRATEIIKNFCTYGNPAPASISNWGPLQEGNNLVLDIGKELVVKRCPEEKRMGLWQKILEFYKRNTILGHMKAI